MMGKTTTSFQIYNVLICSRCKYFTFDSIRHRRDLGLGHNEAYIGNCSAWNQDVRILDTDGGCNRKMDCPYFKMGQTKFRK